MVAQHNDERAASIHTARVYLAEARRRRGQPFHTTLLDWAANARRRASAPSGQPGEQGCLFAGGGAR